MSEPVTPHWSDFLVRTLSAAKLLAEDEQLSARQIAVLALSCHPDEARREVRAIANACGINRPAVSRAADRLAVLGLVRRRILPRDLRICTINATDKGRERAALLAPIATN